MYEPHRELISHFKWDIITKIPLENRDFNGSYTMVVIVKRGG